MADKPSMMDKVPSQLDEEELKAEVDVEIPEAMDVEDLTDDMDIEVIPEEDGSVVVDFDPREEKTDEGDFYANLAEELSDADLGRISGELTGEFEENFCGKGVVRFTLTDAKVDSGGNIPSAACNAITVLSQ